MFPAPDMLLLSAANGRRFFFWLGIAAFVICFAVSLFFSPLGTIADRLREVAPWVAAGIIVTEAMWVGGAVLMAYGAGSRLSSGLRVGGRLSEYRAGGRGLTVFRVGLGINFVGAIGTALVIVVGVVVALPVATWPSAILLALLDIVATVLVRLAIYKGLPPQARTSGSN